MPRWLQRTFGGLIGFVVVAAPFAYAKHSHFHLRNFRVVREAVLYRSGQLSPEGLQRIVSEYRIKTVVTLRAAQEPGTIHPDSAEEDWCLSHGIKHFRLPQKPWIGADGSCPNEANVIKFRQIMADPANHPVLVHCFAGKHRTGAFCAVFRMEHDRWANALAMQEMKAFGYDELDGHLDLLGYLTRYEPTWKN